MIALFRTHDTTAQAWTIGNWYEHQGHEASVQFRDFDAAAAWLRGFESHDLRQLVLGCDDSTPLVRTTDPMLVDQLASLVVSGALRVWRANTAGDADAANFGTGLGHSIEDKLVRRLSLTAQAFLFEGQRFRIVSARQWSRLRAYGDGRYQVVARHPALTLLDRMSRWPALSADERRALEEAAPLVPDSRQPQFGEGILLLQIVARQAAVQARGEGAITPSRLAARQPQEDLHWIEIVLIDAVDEPVPNEPYKLELPDGSIRTGRLDADGRAYVGGFKPAGQCRVCFPEIDATEWSAA